MYIYIYIYIYIKTNKLAPVQVRQPGLVFMPALFVFACCYVWCWFIVSVLFAYFLCYLYLFGSPARLRVTTSWAPPYWLKAAATWCLTNEIGTPNPN